MSSDVTLLPQPGETPHRRFNPLSGEWVLVSPHRTKRPWLGQQEKLPPEARLKHDPGCYLCPGGKRAGGVINPEYEGPFVFTNDFAALLPEAEPFEGGSSELFRAEAASGTSRVICYSPRHDLTMPELERPEIRAVVDVWAEQTAELGKTYKWVQVFENKGEIMGCSNPHPHGQIWAVDSLPSLPAHEEERQAEYFRGHGSPMLRDVLELERRAGTRLVLENELWSVIVPYWAAWPYEILLLPRTDVARLSELKNDQRDALADILKRMLTKYDHLFGVSFPYSMGWHGAPYPEEAASDHWTLHAHFFPPLLRSATVKKFMVGFEMMAEPQRDLTPELAAARLRELPETQEQES